MNRLSISSFSLSGALALSLLIALLWLPVLQVHAAPLDIEQASAKATAKFGGEVVKADAEQHNGQPVFVIRLLTNGRVKEVLIEQKSGKIISPNKE
jgi:uncharacterized membrane protein YkoI